MFVHFSILAVAALLHVGVKEVTGSLPDFHIISVIITVFLGGFLFVLPLFYQQLLTGKPVEKHYTESTIRNLEWTLATLAYLLIISLLIYWSGVYTAFHLETVLLTLFFGGFPLTIWAVSEKDKKKTGD